MLVIALFIILMAWMYAAFNLVTTNYVRMGMMFLGILVPMGILAFVLNLMWYLYKSRSHSTAS